MKTIKMVLGGLFWPVMVLFWGHKEKTSLGSRLGFSVIGIFTIALLATALWLSVGFYPDEIRGSLIFAVESMVLAVFYFIVYGIYLSDHKRVAEKDADSGTKLMSDSVACDDDDALVSEFRTKEEFLDTLKRVEEHGRKARAAWARSQGGGIFIFPNSWW